MTHLCFKKVNFELKTVEQCMFIYNNPNKIKRVSQGLGKQGNIGKISKGTREHEPILREQGNKTLQNTKTWCANLLKGEHKIIWKTCENIVQLWRGTREQGPPRGHSQ